MTTAESTGAAVRSRIVPLELPVIVGGQRQIAELSPVADLQLIAEAAGVSPAFLAGDTCILPALERARCYMRAVNSWYLFSLDVRPRRGEDCDAVFQMKLACAQIEDSLVPLDNWALQEASAALSALNLAVAQLVLCAAEYLLKAHASATDAGLDVGPQHLADVLSEVTRPATSAD